MEEKRNNLTPIPDDLNRITDQIIGAAIEVHRHLGPGFLESVYEKALVHELQLNRLNVEQQKPIQIAYKDLVIENQRVDLFVEPGIIVELKAVESFLPIHAAQLLSYLKATHCRVGLLINFNKKMLKNGIKRIAL